MKSVPKGSGSSRRCASQFSLDRSIDSITDFQEPPMMRIAALFVLCLTAATSASFAQPPRVTPPCDRACLEGFVDRYLDAMLANEVNPKLFARNVKFTENGVHLPLGNEGLWFGMSGKGKYKFYVPDVETQQVAFIGTVVENTRNRG